MAIKIDCPRCKRPLSVPRKKAGGYVNCPECSGRFWVPEEAPAAVSSPAAAAARSAATAAASGGVPLPEPPPAPPPPPLPKGTPNSVSMRDVPSAFQPQSTPMPVPPAAPDLTPAPPAPPPVRKVARLISAEAAQSKLKIAADGQLPELQLQEGDRKEKAEEKSTTVHPLVLLGVIAMSVVVSISLVLYDTDRESTFSARAKAHARRMVEEDYFGEIGGKQPLKPHQIYLREAQQAHTRRDFKTERQLYRKVLDLLRAERPEDARGLTGSRQRDKDLQQHISTLLSNP